MSTRTRRWVFTLHDYTEDQCVTLLGLEVQYVMYGKEVCPTTGRPHLQGFMVLKKPKTMSSLKKFIGIKSIHLKVMGEKDGFEKNLEYCKKEGDWYESGVLPAPGRRSDLEGFREAIDDGMTEEEISKSMFTVWAKYPGLYKRYKSLTIEVESPRYPLEAFKWSEDFRDPDWSRSLIFWGSPGIGKTEFAKSLLGEGYLLVSHLDQLGQFDPSKHSGIIFDDMSFLHHPRESQIHLLDQENTRAIHIRYGCAIIPPNTKKIFTTNVEGGRIFLLDDGAIGRRAKVHHFHQ